MVKNNKNIKKFLVLDKRQGQTPLDLINEYKENNPAYAYLKMAFAGRLDPLATGKMLILIGEECKKRDQYNGLDKEYEFEVLLGFSTDTGDVMGLADRDKKIGLSDNPIFRGLGREPWKRLLGKQEFPYPLFSSKPVDGKPLFAWALEGNTDHLEIPTKEVEIHKLDLTGEKTITKKELASSIEEKINSIPVITDPKKSWGKDFRRPEIRARWDDIFENIDDAAEYKVLKFRCIASSGTYMRTLAGEIGKLLGTKGLAYSIHRTKIGRYNKYIRLWTRKY